ncbi:immunity 26/phosphotriesterase HocA family protein [Flavobacterium chuncheonense]|uniref:Immunity 26/phosphotriesterase HocA family protein n=1 Tax=Flavobacterium chuncheonense TaxID=2026653 RepID=A0ABW5YJY9_9FLAO
MTNEQRKYFGLDPIENHWDKVVLKGDKYRPESILYFEKDTIKRHIVSTENQYIEKHYNELTKNRAILLPKTSKGKEKKLTPSVLEQRQPTGIYLNVSFGYLTIGNYNSQTTFYSSIWHNEEPSNKSISEILNDFIISSPQNHFTEIEQFKGLKRKNIKFKSGDYFSFKIDRINYGFGRILLDIGKIKKKKLINEKHGLNFIMSLPVLIELFAFTSNSKNIDIASLDKKPKLPSDIMMDNLFLYGEYEIIGHREINDNEFDFPISYRVSFDQSRKVFLQWGLIHQVIPKESYNKYIYTNEMQIGQNPYSYNRIGFRPAYNGIDILKTVQNEGVYDFDQSTHYKAKWDLRNPRNKEIKDELFKTFGLDSTKNYYENSKLTQTILPSEMNKQLK